MSNKSVKGSPDYHFQGPKTTFPLSRDFTFTAAPGMLLPVMRKVLSIGEKVKVNPTFFLRTDPLLAPSMTDIDVYVENYFVPLGHILGMFNEWFTQVDDASSDMYDPNNWDPELPVIRSANSDNAFSWMTKNLFNTQIKDSYIDNYNLNNHTYGFDLHRLVNMMGYNAQALFYHAALPSSQDMWDGIVDDYGVHRMLLNRDCPAFVPYYFAAYQKIYMDVYRDSSLEHNNVKAYNFDSVMNAATGWFDPSSDYSYPGTYWGSTSTRLGMFELRFRNRNKDYFTSIHPSPLFNKLGFVTNVQNNVNTIHNWLTTGIPALDDANYPHAVQSESFFNISANLSGTTGSDLGRWHEYGNTTWPSSDAAASLGASTHGLAYAGHYSIEHDHSVSGTASGTGVFQEMNIATMRGNFAFEKLLRVMNNAGRHADDQLFALFGVKVPQGISNEVYRLKSYHTMVHLGEVVSTAQTQDSSGNITPLGEMAGRGQAVLKDQGFDFTAPCHGIVMSIFSIAPRYKYVGAVEKDGFKVTLMDFFRPQTDNLGQQPMFAYELGYTVLNDTQTTRLSWQYAHMEDKCTFDKASIAFVTNGLNPWSFCAVPPYFKMGTNYGTMYKFNKITGNALDAIMVAEYDGNQTYPNVEGEESVEGKWFTNFPTAYLRDPFKVDFHVDMLFTSSMSRFGEPELGSI